MAAESTLVEVATDAILSSSPRTDDDDQTKAPGFGLPLNYYPPLDLESYNPYSDEVVDRPFPSALHQLDIRHGRTTLALTTLREFKMLHIMNQITDKPEWHVKVFDEAISEKWKQEALATRDRDLTSSMMKWVIDELRYKAKGLEKTGAVVVYTGDVVKSDSAVPESVKLELQAAVKPLEDVPDNEKDWHPGSHEKVLDLVHPSLFPLVYGRSKVLETGRTILEDAIEMCGKGVVVPVPSEDETEVGSRPTHGYQYRAVKHPYSRKFQWLPCDVDLSSGNARITSYINNLHPKKYQNLYSLIERVIDAAIPLWNISLAPTVKWNWGTRIYYNGSYTNPVVKPDAGDFVPRPEHPPLDLRQTYKDQGLQVIVKLANIELTPQKPTYIGGSWHVEGQLNEHICATALYYYCNENIQDSKLAFRQQSNVDSAMEMDYEQDQHDFLPIVFGVRTEDPGIQLVGGVDTREGRLLTFPNILQHQVQPFALKDTSKPGRRKILALFLVDPHIRVLSTAKVPPQQKEWWMERLSEVKTALDKLPQELRDEVFGDVKDGFPIGLKEAKELRAELMEERKGFELKHESAFKSLEFSLCEH